VTWVHLLPVSRSPGVPRNPVSTRRRDPADVQTSGYLLTRQRRRRRKPNRLRTPSASRGITTRGTWSPPRFLHMPSYTAMDSPRCRALSRRASLIRHVPYLPWAFRPPTGPEWRQFAHAHRSDAWSCGSAHSTTSSPQKLNCAPYTVAFSQNSSSWDMAISSIRLRGEPDQLCPPQAMAATPSNRPQSGGKLTNPLGPRYRRSTW